MNLKCVLPVVFLIAFVFSHAALAQTCPNTNPETDYQLGCPDPFYTALTRPVISRGIIEFNITVKNRKIIFPPNCNPGDQFCYDNLNFQGLPLCNPDGWSGKFTDVKVELLSCYPDCKLQGCPNCDFNITVTPSKPQNLENEKSQNYTVRINPYSTMGNYDFTFSAFLSSVKKKVFSLRLNISSQASGTEGDNAMCTDCSTGKCDTNETVCKSSCPNAVYCKAPDCFFDTSYSDAAESCCGDDTGEILKRCLKSTDIQWSCPQVSSCCGDRGSCAYSGKCYSEGKAYLTSGEDQYAYCYLGAWHDCDESMNICSGCGFLWNNSACCGDDSNEYYKSRMCFSGCVTNLTDTSCCTLGSACVYNGQCYATEAVIALGKKNITCAGGVWYEKTSNQSVCYKGTCNNNDKCDGSCPGCIFKDYSCYGTNCEADFIDPDMHWTYCANCSLNWSFSQKECCGDDEKEYWVGPCPNSNASWRCCSNPNERVNSRGECAISCGIGVITNLTEFVENLVPLAVSLSSDVLNVRVGGTSEFKVMVRTDGSHSLHNIALNLCGPFTFEASPSSIEELNPGQTRNFTVKITAPPDSALGTQEFAVYVSSSELIRQRYKSGLVNVGMPEYSYDVYLWIILAVVAVYVAKKLLLRRREKPPKETTPEKQASKKKYAKSRRESGMRELVELIRKDLGKGTPEKELMSMLISSGLKEEDVQAAFKQARKKG